MLLKIKFSSNNFHQDWELFEHPSMIKITNDEFYSKYWNIELYGYFNPYNLKLMNLDIFKIVDGICEIIHSSIRSLKYIPAIVKNGYAYSDDVRNPVFITNYNTKDTVYTLIKYLDWDEFHPRCNIIKVLGPVKNIKNYYEYQMYSKCLYTDTTHIPITNEILDMSYRDYLQSVYDLYKIQDRTNQRIITIDPSISREHDDAFGITQYNDTSFIISIYITNIPLWLEYYGLWDIFKERIENVHYPDQKRPLLPSILTEQFCSLKERTTRIAFVLDIYVEHGEIVHIDYNNALIYIEKNYTHTDNNLVNDITFKNIKSLCTSMFHKRKFKTLDRIESSQDVVTYLMLLMNYISACEFKECNNGIFRSSKGIPLNSKDYNKLLKLPRNVRDYITQWNKSGSQYHLYESKEKHSVLHLQHYVHMTSPIRRLVDILNIYQMQKNWSLVKYSQQSNDFYEYWNYNLDFINASLRSVRRLPQDISLREYKIKDYYNGYIIDILKRNDGLYQYIIYIDELKIASRYISKEKKDLFHCTQYSILWKHNNKSKKLKCMISDCSVM